MALNSGGASLGVSAALATEMGELTAHGLASVVTARRAAGRPAISFAVVFPYSMHNYMLRFWAASAGVDPDQDIRIVVAPPTAMAARLASGEIDGFCVGAPWGAVCEAESSARIVLDAAGFWPGGPEKVLGLSSRWFGREPGQAIALVRAVARAAKWADEPANAAELAMLLSQREWLDAPRDLIEKSLGQIRFARDGAQYPSPGHAAWIASQMLRWGQVDASADIEAALACYRPDLFRAAGLEAPAAKGGFVQPIIGGESMGAKDLRSYAANFAITRFQG
jgi:NitT/TauT family transport system ATP-binding protein/nitrate/nitrite transport system substrate-binding protein